MLNLRQQLESTPGNIVIANIPETTLNIGNVYNYIVKKHLLYAKCTDLLNQMTGSLDDKLTVSYGDTLELGEYLNMDKKKQSIWDSLYKDNLLCKFDDFKIYESGNPRRVFITTPLTEDVGYTYYETVHSAGTTVEIPYILDCEVDDLLNDGSLKLEDLGKVRIISLDEYNDIYEKTQMVKG